MVVHFEETGSVSTPTLKMDTVAIQSAPSVFASQSTSSSIARAVSGKVRKLRLRLFLMLLIPFVSLAVLSVLLLPGAVRGEANAREAEHASAITYSTSNLITILIGEARASVTALLVASGEVVYEEISNTPTTASAHSAARSAGLDTHDVALSNTSIQRAASDGDGHSHGADAPSGSSSALSSEGVTTSPTMDSSTTRVVMSLPSAVRHLSWWRALADSRIQQLQGVLSDEELAWSTRGSAVAAGKVFDALTSSLWVLRGAVNVELGLGSYVDSRLDAERVPLDDVGEAYKAEQDAFLGFQHGRHAAAAGANAPLDGAASILVSIVLHMIDKASSLMQVRSGGGAAVGPLLKGQLRDRVARVTARHNSPGAEDAESSPENGGETTGGTVAGAVGAYAVSERYFTIVGHLISLDAAFVEVSDSSEVTHIFVKTTQLLSFMRTTAQVALSGWLAAVHRRFPSGSAAEQFVVASGRYEAEKELLLHFVREDSVVVGVLTGSVGLRFEEHEKVIRGALLEGGTAAYSDTRSLRSGGENTTVTPAATLSGGGVGGQRVGAEDGENVTATPSRPTRDYSHPAVSSSATATASASARTSSDGSVGSHARAAATVSSDGSSGTFTTHTRTAGGGGGRYNEYAANEAAAPADGLFLFEASLAGELSGSFDAFGRDLQLLMVRYIAQSHTLIEAHHQEAVVTLVLDVGVVLVALVATVVLGYIFSVQIARPFVRQQQLKRALKAKVVAMVEHEESLSRFVSSGLVALLRKRNFGDVLLGDHVLVSLTIMFSDVWHFTTLSERFSPMETFQLVNSFYSRTADHYRAGGGMIDKYLGDGVLSLFTEVSAAIHVANALHDEAEQVSREYRVDRRCGFVFQVGVGVHSGDVVLGTVGSAERMDVTIISDAANTASRVESYTRQYDAPTLISDAARQRLSADDHVTRYVGSVYPKGKEVSVGLYEPISADTDVAEVKRELLREWEEVVELAGRGRMGESVSVLERYLERCGGVDGVAVKKHALLLKKLGEFGDYVEEVEDSQRLLHSPSTHPHAQLPLPVRDRDAGVTSSFAFNTAPMHSSPNGDAPSPSVPDRGKRGGSNLGSRSGALPAVRKGSVGLPRRVTTGANRGAGGVRKGPSLLVPDSTSGIPPSPADDDPFPLLPELSYSRAKVSTYPVACEGSKPPPQGHSFEPVSSTLSGASYADLREAPRLSKGHLTRPIDGAPAPRVAVAIGASPTTATTRADDWRSVASPSQTRPRFESGVGAARPQRAKEAPDFDERRRIVPHSAVERAAARGGAVGGAGGAGGPVSECWRKVLQSVVGEGDGPDRLRARFNAPKALSKVAVPQAADASAAEVGGAGVGEASPLVRRNVEAAKGAVAAATDSAHAPTITDVDDGAPVSELKLPVQQRCSTRPSPLSDASPLGRSIDTEWPQSSITRSASPHPAPSLAALQRRSVVVTADASDLELGVTSPVQKACEVPSLVVRGSSTAVSVSKPSSTTAVSSTGVAGATVGSCLTSTPPLKDVREDSAAPPPTPSLAVDTVHDGGEGGSAVEADRGGERQFPPSPVGTIEGAHTCTFPPFRRLKSLRSSCGDSIEQCTDVKPYSNEAKVRAWDVGDVVSHPSTVHGGSEAPLESERSPTATTTPGGTSSRTAQPIVTSPLVAPIRGNALPSTVAAGGAVGAVSAALLGGGGRMPEATVSRGDAGLALGSTSTVRMDALQVASSDPSGGILSTFASETLDRGFGRRGGSGSVDGRFLNGSSASIAQHNFPAEVSPGLQALLLHHSALRQASNSASSKTV